jgi:hypothetical protein
VRGARRRERISQLEALAFADSDDDESEDELERDRPADPPATASAAHLSLPPPQRHTATCTPEEHLAAPAPHLDECAISDMTGETRGTRFSSTLIPLI